MAKKQETLLVYPTTLATSEKYSPQVEWYPDEQRAEQREHLKALNAAHSKSQDTKSERVKWDQYSIIAREFAYFEKWHAGLVERHDHYQDKERMTGYSLRPTVAEERERVEWEVEYLLRDADRDVTESRKSLVKRLGWLRDDLDRALRDLKNDPNAHVSSTGIVQRQGSEIDQLCVEIVEQEKRASHLRRMAKYAAPQVVAKRDAARKAAEAERLAAIEAEAEAARKVPAMPGLALMAATARQDQTSETAETEK